jgi:hypothetical protein
MTGLAAWPAAGKGLLDELAASRDRYALVPGDGVGCERLLDRFTTDLELDAVRLGAALAERHEAPPSRDDILAACGTATVLTDLDVLFWPALEVSVLPVLRKLAARRPIVAVWPGEITHGRARYSEPGRPDYLNERLTDVLVLRPRDSRFADEMPYETERITR